MLTRARRALPGMAVAVLLANPAFADQITTADPAPRKTAAQPRKAPQVSRAATRPATPAVPAASLAAPILSDSQGSVWRQTGIASWYGGSRWQGNRTASGARYDQNLLTAAHATLPIGTRVRVTLEGSDRSVVVLINDRPGTRRRIIDLSRGAAAELGILSQGIAVVTLTAL